jgi:2-dehydro-3-deoxygluconokinase
MNMARSFDIVALGEAMVEFNQTGGTGGREYLQGFGGDSSNFAIAAARQGAKVAYLSALGDDPYGQMLRELWEREGVDHQHVTTDHAAPTGIYLVSHGAQGHRFDFFRSGSAASRIRPEALPLEAIAQARVLHLSGISLGVSNSACDTAFAAIAHARANGVQVSFDTNLRLKLWSLARARAIMNEAIRLSDICLPSFEDISAISGLSEPDALVDHCLALGAQTVALKLGARGALVANASERHTIAPFPCRPIDATGAGDVFGGVFVTRLLAGDNLAQAGLWAAAAAALSTQGFGAVEPIPHRADVQQALAQQAASTPFI